LRAALARLSGCGGGATQRKVAAAGAAIPVQTATAAAERWPDPYEATGTVRVRTAAVLSSKVMVYVRDVAVQVGDRVGGGQVLVTLESEDLDANVRRTEAAEAEVRSAIPKSRQRGGGR
jgi:multidrug efflux pump subunit AcrA (membrane-fusion protein)